VNLSAGNVNIPSTVGRKIVVDRMKDSKVHDVLIIGGGPAGTSAAIYASRGKLDTLVIDKDMGQGAMGGEHLVANYPGFSEPTKAEDILKKMRDQAVSLGAEFLQDKVIYTDFRKEVKEIATPSGTIKARTVVLASGSMGREPSIEGEGMFIGRGVAYCAICDGAYFEGKEVAVTGQVDRVLEELDIISKYATKVHFISPTGKISQEELGRLSDLERVVPLPGYRVKKILGGMQFEGILLEGPDGEEKMDVPGIFVYLQGNKPVTEYIVDSLEKDESGCLKVDETDMSTSIPGVFAVGDIRCKPYRQISIAVSDGCRAALSADRFIKGKDKIGSQWGE
jgi:thioredoxin reductase (NADPH)